MGGKERSESVALEVVTVAVAQAAGSQGAGPRLWLANGSIRRGGQRRR